MVIIKKNYYLYIENIKDINLDKLINSKKIIIILRDIENNNLSEIKKYRQKCKNKRIKFYIANNAKIAKLCNADGLYISSYNKRKYYINLPKIGSAHNLKEIKEKINQNCKKIIFSRLFKTTYPNKPSYHGILKFNLLNLKFKFNLIPLGGINHQNLLKLNMVKSNGFAILSGVKKKPAISSRLF